MSLDDEFFEHPIAEELFVKTLWFNERTDVHATLDKTKYIAP